MKTKPLSIKLIALCFLLAPIGNIIQIAFFNHWPLTGPRSVVYHFSNYEWFVLACFPLIAYGVWTVSKWGYFVCLTFASFLIVHNTYATFINQAYSPYIILLFQCVTFAVVGFFLQKHIMAPYFNPKLRWWQNSPRFKVSLRGQARIGQAMNECQILDVSIGGCYIEMKKDLGLGDLVWIQISLKEWSMSALGKVMWVKSAETSGYGLMFISIEKPAHKTLTAILKFLMQNQKKSVALSGPPSDTMSA